MCCYLIAITFIKHWNSDLLMGSELKAYMLIVLNGHILNLDT